MDIALDDGSAFKLDGWKYISEAFPSNTLHFIGLLSDGGVHSRYNQLVAFVKGAAKDGAKRIRVHILTVRACGSSCAVLCCDLVRAASPNGAAVPPSICCAFISRGYWKLSTALPEGSLLLSFPDVATPGSLCCVCAVEESRPAMTCCVLQH